METRKLVVLGSINALLFALIGMELLLLPFSWLHLLAPAAWPWPFCCRAC